MTIMVTLQDPESAAMVRVEKADDYPGYEGWAVVVEEEWPTLDMLKEQAWSRVKAERAARLLLAPTPPFGTAQTDLESLVKINGLVSMAMLAEAAGQPFLETFTMADNSEVEMDGPQVLSFVAAVGQHIAAVHARGRELRAAIRDAESAEALDNIDLSAGWP